MKADKTELNDTEHETILEQGRTRFPLESYRQLRATGASRMEVLAMLGFREEDVPEDVRD